MSYVFVIDTNKQPLNPVHPGRARMLLSSGQAAVFKRYPFTLILRKDASTPNVVPLRLKLDPGSKTTGMAIVNDDSGDVVFAAELQHRGQRIQEALERRRNVRRNRRQRKTRYRQARFVNRRRPRGWLPPSLESRIANVVTWARRLMRYCSIAAISLEVVKFDMQRAENPDISGVEYQQGTLAGYEVREYLLEKWGRQCAYCGGEDVPLQIEHIVCRARHGSDRISNLTLACEPCNVKKGTQDLRIFLKDQPERLARLLAQAKTPLRDAAAVNATRWELYRRLLSLDIPIERGSGGRTKYNRITRGLKKAHWIDAVCVGTSTPERVGVTQVHPLTITATGHGRRQMCLMGKYGFPRTGPKRARKIRGFQTGDIVRAIVTTGKRRGIYLGRVAVRANGFFDLTTPTGVVPGISYRYCTRLHRRDGYNYHQTEAMSLFLPRPESVEKRGELLIAL